MSLGEARGCRQVWSRVEASPRGLDWSVTIKESQMQRKTLLISARGPTRKCTTVFACECMCKTKPAAQVMLWRCPKQPLELKLSGSGSGSGQCLDGILSLVPFSSLFKRGDTVVPRWWMLTRSCHLWPGLLSTWFLTVTPHSFRHVLGAMNFPPPESLHQSWKLDH